jgi:hypothetical protein
MDVTLENFKKLLSALKERNIGLKVRTHTGWSKDYLQIIGFIASMNDQKNKTFGGVVLSNLTETEGIMINNISTITAFELHDSIERFESKKVYVLKDNTLKALIID